jgi:GrpB-like predicted nucleotidyltransferase (UPF0157 family)
MIAPRLLFVPLDDRPVTRGIVADLARSAGMHLGTPDQSMLGDRFHPGEVERVWAWLEHEAAGAAALIGSVEMLCMGGLVASRKRQVEFTEIAPRLHRLYEVAARLPTYLSAVIPRTPLEATDEDAADSTMGRHRSRQLELNRDLIETAARGKLRYVLIGQDDTWPGSPSQIERETLQAHVVAMGAANVLLTSGADELNARLFARWLNDLTGAAPSVRVLYTYPEETDQIPRYESTPLRQTVDEHIHSAGCRLGGDDADIVLWVHNFAGQQGEAQDQTGKIDLKRVDAILTAMRVAARHERVVAFADVGFANGADRAVVARLLEEPRFAGIVAYAGWNTCSNTLGSVIAQAVVAYHLRACTIPGDDRIYRVAFFTRLLDDWGYQSVVRPELTQWLGERGETAALLDAQEGATEAAALDRLRGEVLPLLQRSFVHHPITLPRATFPWHRLFEICLEVEVATAAPRRGISVVAYDVRWPRMYESEKAAILQALGPLVRGIEHVGSTAIPQLAAQPVIDILLGVEVEDLDTIIAPLERIGYQYNPDWEISLPMRRYFRRMTRDGTRTHHLHAVPYGGDFWTRHLAFRDYLRMHPDKAREYTDLKEQIAAQTQSSLDYPFAKTEFIRSVEALAGIAPGRLRPRSRTS